MSLISGIPKKFDLTGRWALITGAAGLLGRQHASALLEVGAKVVLWDINKQKLINASKMLSKEFHPSSIVMDVVDISNEGEVIHGQESLEKNGIFISILLNNAAMNPKYGSNGNISMNSRLENFNLLDWNQQISIGLTGAFICSKNFGRKMSAKKNGVILNIASDLSIIAPDQRIYKVNNVRDELQPVKPITYSVIKSGLVGMTRYLATYWNTSGVRVNSLSPGGVYEDQDGDFIKKISELIPLGRLANPDEYKSAIQFLCSDASSYMTGQNLVIDGGRSVW